MKCGLEVETSCSLLVHRFYSIEVKGSGYRAYIYRTQLHLGGPTYVVECTIGRTSVKGRGHVKYLSVDFVVPERGTDKPMNTCNKTIN